MSKKFLVYDPQGLFVEHAAGLAKNGNKVKYFTPFNSHYAEYVTGLDYKGLEKSMYFFDDIEDADVLVNFDVRQQDLFAFLREQFPKKSVFGSGHACKLEDDRELLKKMIEKMGLPAQKYKCIKGIENLREHLKSNKNKYVKLNIFRGDMESFYSSEYESVELKLDQIEGVFGPHKNEYEFIIEDCIDTDVEIGADLFFNGEDFLKPYLYGYEWRKNLYIGKVTDKLCLALEETMNKFKPLLKKLDYRSATSWEEKIVSQKEHYILDFCARLASPFTAGYPEWIENWPELVESVGRKGDVKPEFKSKYFGAFTLKSMEALDVYVKVNIKDESKVKMLMACGNKKGNYAVKGDEEIAIVIADGNSVDDVLRKLHKNADAVDADGLDKDPMKSIDAIKDIIEEGRKVGVEF